VVAPVCEFNAGAATEGRPYNNQILTNGSVR